MLSNHYSVQYLTDILCIEGLRAMVLYTPYINIYKIIQQCLPNEAIKERLFSINH